MTAVISTTYDDKYLWFLPLTVWGWNHLGVNVVCFMPYNNTSGMRFMLVSDTLVKNNARGKIHNFDCPEHKEATYAQCSRLYGACLDLPEDEILITSDIDMFVFSLPSLCCEFPGMMVFGHDLTPPNQYPMCYISGTVKQWREAMSINWYHKTYQFMLDSLLGGIDCDNMRGNYWGKDQEEAYSKISDLGGFLVPRAKEGTQFASHRYDRDDAFILDRLSLDTIDYHMNRPGYTDDNFSIIMKVLKYHYPHEDFTWLVEYNEQYKKLL